MTTAADDGHEAHGEPDPAAHTPPDPPVDPPPRARGSGYRADGTRPRTRHASTGTGRGGQGRSYRWEPFRPGDMVRLAHGAHAPAIVEPLAAELVEAAAASSPYLDAPEFRGELLAWSRAEAKVILLSRWLAEHGQLDDEGNPRPAAEFLVKVERTAADRRHALGLTPMARARLGRDVTAARVDLAALWAEDDDDGRDEGEPDDRRDDDEDTDAVGHEGDEGEPGDDGEDGAHGWSEVPA